jgi:hypothetical protein
MKRWLLFAASALMAQVGSAWAVGGLADVTVYDRAEHRQLPVYYHEGKYYVVGQPGNPYQINVRSQSGEDLLAVTSVDGVNVVSGETASSRQGGYVLNGYQSTDIKGWRKSVDRIAQFYFTDLPDSYAARTGRPDDVGVIGVALFRRKQEPVVIEPYEGDYERDRAYPRGESSSPAPSAPADAAKRAPQGGVAESERRSAQRYQPESKLGTGHGQSERSPVRYTEFERASESPDEIIAIHYDSYRNLAALGVIAHEPRPYAANPFPGHFVPDPPRRRNW